VPEIAFECEHVRIMFCELLTVENKPRMDTICEQCQYHRHRPPLFCFPKPMVRTTTIKIRGEGNNLG
jgi:hypothetical protein